MYLTSRWISSRCEQLDAVNKNNILELHGLQHYALSASKDTAAIKNLLNKS